ncbi:hypothetical protein EBBID32_35120 [Sphingobium indicum BiD32]|uniref:Uncharacterized protein n=1 Tax=Sphingobium indicum BiD32 TaxID=1301087 RepID=N1MU32_9SPHN|nr:hypothetical protein [Sphingobium indicum]CCW19147.1 hypothetical protein EBBID32_35120 [Sphingobium indicum BiD32]
MAANARADGKGQRRRTCVKHVIAKKKAKMGLFIRTIGIRRAEARITPATWRSICTG